MGFADDLAANSTGPRRTVCGVSVALEKLGAKDRKDLIAALGNGEHTASAIGRTLRSEKYGLRIGDGAIARHRRHSCACG